jgi:hypothetical protein
MKMKFRASIDDLNAAVDVVSTVKPLNQNRESAYLLTYHGGVCHLHSQDGARYCRVELPVYDMEGEGGLTFPSGKIGSLKYLEGWIQIESEEKDDRCWVKYNTEGGSSATLATYNPEQFNTLSKRLDEAMEEKIYPTLLLREGFNATSEYAAQPEGEPSAHHIIQIFDSSKEEWAKGDGVMFAADGVRAAYFACDALKGKGLGLHVSHLTHFLSFLGKCGDTVKVKTGESYTFLVDQVPVDGGGFTDGAVFGWTHKTKQPGAYKYYGTNEDKAVILVPKDMALKSLTHIRKTLDSKHSKIRVTYKDNSLQFQAAVDGDLVSSVPVGVKALLQDDGTPSIAEFAYNVSVDSFLELFRNVRSNEVELRVVLVPAAKNRKEAGFFRTIDRYRLGVDGKVRIPTEETKEGSYECQVTRFTPSMF